MKRLGPLAVGICALVLAGGRGLHAGGIVADGREQTFRNALAGGGNVTFNVNAFITLSSSIVIQTNTSIDANGFTVILSGANSNTLFIVAGGVSFTNNGLTLRNGQNTNGGAIYINSKATVVLTNCVLIGNNASGTNGRPGVGGAGNSGIGKGGKSGTAGGNGLGGAIYNLGDLSVLNSQVFSNSAAGGNGGNGGNGGDGVFTGGNGGGGGIGGTGRGGGIYNLGTLRLQNCTFAGNSVAGGGGGTGGAGGSGAFGGFSGNGGAGGSGWGAGLDAPKANVKVVVLNCTFSDNTAQGGNGASAGTSSRTQNGNSGKNGGNGSGGGICNIGALAATNCTFFRNSALGGEAGDGGSGNLLGGKGGNGGKGTGGGLYNSGTVRVVNCTFSTGAALGGTNGLGGPPAGSNGAKGKSQGGNIANGANAANFVLMNSIIATNSSGGGGYGPVTDAGNNISSDKSITLKNSTSRVNTDPELGPLSINGGPTATMALLTTNNTGIKTNSPAIDRIAPTNAPSLDQRGVPRPFGSASDIGSFEEQPPFIQTQPQSQSQTNGGPVTFTVTVIGDAPLSYQWRLGGTNISGAIHNTYSIANVTAANAGSYDVTVSNVSGSITSMLASLTVNFPPSITVQPTNQLVQAGSPVIFIVVATGDSPLIYQWQLNGTNISGATNTAYSITNAQSVNAGTYTVSITNAFGSITSAPAVLSIGVPPFIITQPVSQTAIAGSNVTFSVIAGGNSQLTYQWRFNLSSIDAATGPTYSKSIVQPKDAGSYDVVVGNSFGTIESAAANLIVVGPALTQPCLVSSNFNFVYQTQTGFDYVVEFKHSLTDPVWTPLTTNTGTGNLITNSTVVGTESSRFFRVRVQ